MTIRSKAELTTLFADNSNGDISAQDLRDFLDSVNGSFGGMYVSSAAATTSMPLSSPVKAAGTTTATSLQNFTHADNRLTYTGPTDIHAHIACSASFTSNKNDSIVGVYIAKNGIALPAPGLRTIANGADIGSTAVHGDSVLSTNDYIEVFVSINAVSSPSVTLDQCYLFAMGMLT